MKNIWKDSVEEHDYPAALDYLELILPTKESEKIVEKLKNTTIIKKKAKDIIRASGLPLLTKKNIHVKENIKKVKNGEKLSPILLCVLNGKLVIADGYHRVCCIYSGLSEDLQIPCKLVYHNTN